VRPVSEAERLAPQLLQFAVLELMLEREVEPAAERVRFRAEGGKPASAPSGRQ